MSIGLHDPNELATSPTERFFSLTTPQIPIWIDQALYPQKPIYHIGQTLILQTAVDIEFFVAALERVAAENDALRLRFTKRDSDIVQQVVSEVSVHLEFKDFSRRSDPETAAKSWIEQLFWQPLSVTDFPLFKFALAKVAADRFLWLQKYHHLIIDATGRRLVAARVAAIYDSISSGVEPPLAECASYPVLARASDDQYFASGSWAADEEYWRTRFADLPDPLVNTDARPTEKSRSGRSTQLACGLSFEESDALRILARSQGSTVFKVLFALVWCCLARLYLRSDLVVGVPLGNRKGTDARRAVGQFAKVMPFRPRLDMRMTLAAALSALDNDLSKDLEHQGYPFHYLNRLLPHARGLEGLYDVIVNFQRSDYGFSLGGGPVSCSSSSIGFSVPLSITAFEHSADAPIHIVIAYDPGRISSEDATRFLRCLQQLLRCAPVAAEIEIGRLPMVSEAERTALVQRGQGERVTLPKGMTLPTLLAYQAARSPDATALVCGEERLTYAELHARADRLAQRLRSRGIGPDTLVGISLPRVTVLIVAILAVHKAGGAYLPLDPSYPQQRIDFIVEDSKTRVVLTDRAHAALFSSTDAQLLLLDEGAEIAQAPSALEPECGVEPSDLAYVLYTSGSTGNPKGVAVTHASAVNLIFSARRLINDEESSGFLCATSLNFDISVYEVFLPLACGGAIILVDNLFGLAIAHARDEVRIVNTVPSLMASYLNDSRLPVGVRVVNLAGEPLPRTLADRIFANRPDVRLFNLYGPTETTVYSTGSVVDRNDRRPPSIGVPLLNTEVYVLDEFLQPVPEGSIGELWIGGIGVSRGYLNRSELTQQRFIPNPFGEGRLYKTGDLVAWLSDGQLGLVGRIDHQVKIRGYRIELGEIESVLRLHSAVGESVVLVRKDAPADERLVAYVTPANSSPIPISELRSLLTRRLPAWMIPSTFVLLDALPLTPNGKLDRKGLPAPEERSLETDHSYVAPRRPMEEVLAGIWCEVLGLKQVGVQDNFFELGGHSLLALRVVSRMWNAFGVDLSLRTFFENPTISSLVDQSETLLQAMKGNESALTFREQIAGEQHQPELRPLLHGARRPLSFAQQRLWFLDQLEPHSTVYSIPIVLGLEGALDVSVLRRSLEEVVRRHETLRTCINSVQGHPAQVISPASSLEIPLIDLNELPEHKREAEVTRLCTEEARRAFDLERDLMLRVRLFRLEPRRHVLFLNLHHIAADGWSIAVLLRELWSLYEVFCQGRPSPLAELPIQYSDFAVWQRDWLRGEVREKQLGYWRTQLAGISALLELPTDRPRPAIQSHRGAAIAVVFPDSLLQAVKALGQQTGASLFMTLMAAFQILLSRYSGQEDISVGFPMAGRNRIELEGLIGLCVNTLVLRGDLSGNPTFLELLKRIREATLGAYAHQDLPFEMVVEELQPGRSLSYTPLFQVLFTLEETASSPTASGELNLTSRHLSSVTSKFDLSIFVSEEAEGLRARAVYCTDLFDQETIHRLLDHFRELLEGIVANPELSIGVLPLLTEVERRQLLVEWNDTSSDYPARTLAELFEEQAAQTPKAVATVFRGSTLTYAEINVRANQLAHYLKKMGVQPGSLVGLCIERSSELIVTLLGILKAGGAYVALDQNFSPSRLKYILEDAQPTVIVVQSEQQSLELHEVQWTKNPPIVVCLEHAAKSIIHESEANPTSGASPEHLAYVCFTSGSSGRPKGVNIPNRAVVRLVKNTNYLSISPSDVFLQLAPVSFDASTFEIWGCLLNGARLVVPPSALMSAAEIGRTIQRHGVSVLWLTAGLFHVMVDHELGRLKGVRKLLAGGDALSVAHARKALEELGDGTLINGYGPTENTTFTCCHPITRLSADRNSIAIGRPISNTQCFILDRRLMPVPIGVRGELFTGGDGLALGYLNDPKLTAAKFIPNPFQPGAVLYRTGDFARFLSDGNIEFLGRIDHQVKISGFRVELGEVESVLTLHPAVRECVVVLHHETEERRLVAYVRLARAADHVELRSFLTERLPTHMIPGTFIFLDTFPLTANGKVDRTRLSAAQGRCSETQKSYVEPRTPTEETLASIWREILNLKRVGVHDNFFELGGNSLMVVRLISTVNLALDVSLGFPEFFQNPTLEQVARIIDGRSYKYKRRPAVIQLQEGDKQPPVYFIYAGSDEFRLARALGAGHPIFGIEVPWRSAWCHAAVSNETALPTLEEIVAPYAAALFAASGSSPCVLAGYSFAGLMAFEAAHQLQKQGGNVEMVILLDSLAQFPSRIKKDLYVLQQDWTQALKNLPAGTSSIGSPLKNSVIRIWLALSVAKKKLRGLFRRVGRLTEHWMFGPEKKALGELTEFLNEEGIPLQWGIVEKFYRRAIQQYRPRRLDCRGVLFRTDPENGVPLRVNDSLGWENLFTRGLEIIPLTSDHLAMIRDEPKVLMLGREMKLVLNRLKPTSLMSERYVNEPRGVSPNPEPRPATSLDGVDRPFE